MEAGNKVNDNKSNASEDDPSCLLCVCLCIYYFVCLLIKLAFESIRYIFYGLAVICGGIVIYLLILLLIKKLSTPDEINFSIFRSKREVPNPGELHPDNIIDFNTYGTEMITLLVIVMIEYILTGLVFWYSRKGKYRLILPYLMFLMITINILLIFFLHMTIQNFQNSPQAGFLVLACGLVIIGNGVYFWIIMYRRYHNLKGNEYLQPII